ncbi:MAG: ATP-binding protein, partial [Nanoarchaeota archaeon]
MDKNLLYWNPWWEKGSFESKLQYRISFADIEPYLARKEVLFFSGVRRSGKTSFMYYLIEQLLDKNPPENILYLNLDDQVLRFETLENIFDAYKTLFPEVEGKIYVFLDEIQNIKDWEVFVKNKYDSTENIKFIISGSKSHVLKRKSSLLTGRMFEREIYPLSFIEFLGFKGFELTKLHMISKKNMILFLFSEYLKFGGFPEVVLEDSERLKVSLLKEYFENIKDKDIITYFNIKESKKFDRMSLFLISNIAKPFSASKIGTVVHLSTQVVGDYLDYAELMYLFLSLNHFNYSIKSQISM